MTNTEYNRLWRKRNPELDAASNKRCARRAAEKYKSNPLLRRAKRIYGTLHACGVSDRPGWREIIQSLSKPIICPYCKILVGFDDISLDHMVPRSRGGAELMSNLQFICKKCNFLKFNWTHEEYLRYLELAQKHPILSELLEIRTVWRN